MWSFLDALFPTDPYLATRWRTTCTHRRGYAFHLATVQRLRLRGFRRATTTSCCHTAGVVSMVQSLNAVNLSNDIERAGEALSAIIGETVLLGRSIGTSTVLPCMATVYHEGIAYEVIDLGRRWYYRIVSEWALFSICLRPPATMKKRSGVVVRRGTFAKTKAYPSLEA